MKTKSIYPREAGVASERKNKQRSAGKLWTKVLGKQQVRKKKLQMKKKARLILNSSYDSEYVMNKKLPEYHSYHTHAVASLSPDSNIPDNSNFSTAKGNKMYSLKKTSVESPLSKKQNIFLFCNDDSEQSDFESSTTGSTFLHHESSDELSSEDSNSQKMTHDTSSEPQFAKKKRKKVKFSENEEISEDDDKNLLTFPVPEKNILIAVLEHPAEVTLEGSLLIQVISGTVSILGHLIQSVDESFLPVFSSVKTSLLELRTEKSEKICKRASLLQNVVKRLQNIGAEKVATSIIDSCTNTSVIVVLKKNRAREIQYACSIIPLVLPFSDKKSTDSSIPPNYLKHFGFTLNVDSEESKAISVTTYHEQLAETILSSIRKSEIEGMHAPRIIVCGGKGLGKSTLLRYLINRVLNRYEQVYHIEGDPGQTEFTPPGCLALTRVTKPLLGPPFTHQKKPERTCFIGNVNVQNSPELYSSSFHNLLTYYAENYASDVLFVNTMGWTTGLGLTLLLNLIRCMHPTFVIQLENSNLKFNTPPLTPKYVYQMENCEWDAEDTLMAEYPEYTLYHVPSSLQNSSSVEVAAPLRRSLAILAYLGRCHQSFQKLTPITNVTPYSIPWTEVALHISNEIVPVDQILYSINGSWVALCSVDESQMLESDDPSLPKLLCNEPQNECHGFGIVRGINPAQKLLYVLTPEPLDVLKKVNTLMKGSVNLPEELILKQEMNGFIPYTRRVMKKLLPIAGTIRRRTHRDRTSKN